jgi:ABC-type transport system involved in multi-copper enzyme maturation permease subunit
MTAVTARPAAQARARGACRLTGFGVLRSEWAKFWSLRSSWITLGISLLLLTAIGLVAASRYSPQLASEQGRHHLIPAGGNAVAVALAGITLAQLATGVLGVLFTAGEYSTGMIRSTLTAVPTRLPMLWSKVAVLGVTALVAGTAGAVVTFLGGEHLLAGQPIALTLSSPGVLRCLVGAGVYLALVAVIGMALGALLRSVAGGIAALVGGLTLLPLLANLLPSNWADDVSPYLPGNAGDAMFALTHDSSTLSPGAGLAVFAGWTVLLLALAAWRLARTDA